MLALLGFFIATAFGQTVTDPIDAHGFYLAPNDGDTLDHLSTWRSEVQTPGTVGVNGLFEYADRPLTLHRLSDGVETTTDLVDDLAVLNLGAFYAPTKQVALTVTAPVYLTSESLDVRSGVGVGDIRVAVPLTVVTVGSSEETQLSVSVVPFADTPGFYQHDLSARSFSGGGLAVVSLDQEKLDVSADVGTEFAPQLDFYNLRGREHLLTNLAISYQVTPHVGAGAELVARPSLRHNEVVGTESPAEVEASVRGQTDDHLGWVVGASKALNHGVSAATWRAFAGVDLSFGKRKTEPVEITCPKCEEPQCEEKVCPVPPEPTPSTVQVEGDHLVLLKPIYFDFDKADIRFPDSQQVMSDLVTVLQEHPEITLLQVATGTDPRGTAEYNQDLSLRRAKSVVAFLVEHGIAQDRLTSVGYGESRLPMGKCSTEACYEQDRFAEFSILQVSEPTVWK